MKTILRLLCLATTLHAHEETPDPALFYKFSPRLLVAGSEENSPPVLKPQFGPPLQLATRPLANESGQLGLRFDKGRQPHLLLAKSEELPSLLPTREFTLAAWFTIDEPQDWGALFSALEDNGDREKGLVLGYNRQRPYVGLATEGADDGDGKMTYLQGKTPYTVGKWHHLVATYDGIELTLYFDGTEAARSEVQSGKILWPENLQQAWIGGYHDSNENYPHEGRLGLCKLFHYCANPSWVAKQFAEGEELAKQEAEAPVPAPPGIVVKPYLQWVRQNEATIMWETAHPCKGILHWGLGSDCDQRFEEEEETTLHEITLTGLEAEMLYYYHTESPDEESANITEVSTFQTATKPGSPIAFTVFCDAQANPQVVNQLAKAAWEFRPNFLIMGGDLVTTGRNKSHWVDHFFANMDPLISRVPFYPVLGNHEQNADHYYHYMHLPEPEYFYTFTQGDVQFFMLDSNKSFAPDSEQYQWLDKELAASTAKWKMAVHHHPPHSSDDDYGNDWKRPISEATNGDRNAKQLITLYDKHGVDIVWNGHIHSYERTWLLRAGQPVEKDGTLYLITGGAGGGLERFGPYRPTFQRQIKTGHHFSYVTCFGGELDVKAYDLEGRLFDHFTLRKD
ncbi:LamG-like jellyroll fold domain-containing protein [Roseibacillus ishigakijimensis]|uniref:Metallophosphoesterase n=1 Tax=Roseibacillus ishigakijimensis TaxID=454146 RepID=A0A934VLF5_9BACT|nr:LamG-like jellyroll fold domain-containing protein [Roseibacillus ishigakijimensis]MBK1834634.1 metallophosphoesterase [Roseibacillus ishigakijimensis]